VPAWAEFNKTPSMGLHVGGVWPNLRLELWCVKRGR
jgi:type VI secretion system protein ImpJ